MDIAAWLRSLGLERYERTFRDNEIDAALLPTLTADDLKDLGVAVVGHRRKLLNAIADLRDGGAATAAISNAEPGSTRPGAAALRPEAERRQLTVLFCDLVDSTVLSGRLDPEDMGQVIRAYQACCAKVVQRWEGYVAKYLGDGVLAYFGWPQAHEDDAERAVRAGLELVANVATLATPGGEKLTARVGIATGGVVVGELIGEGAAQEQAVVGEAPNLAARLQGLAEPGSVVISQATRRLVGGLFKLANLGPQRLKGFVETLAAFRVAGEGRAESRFEALHGERLTPLVGREHELAMLMERWGRAKDGDGQVVLVSGEPGIGKSRLIRTLREELGGEPHVALSHFCSPHHTNSALHPIIIQLERAAGFAPDDAPTARLAKLEALLGQASARLDEAVPLLAALLGIATGDRHQTLNLSPQRQKQRTLEVLIEQLEGLARPVLELYEDVHWVDPSTLELLDLLVERVRVLPVLVVLTFRPEFTPPWIGQSHVSALPLKRLGRRQGAAIVARVTAGKPLPADVLDQIVAKTDGVPLFIEELTKTVLESGLLTDAGDRYQLTRPFPAMAIPTTLHDSLMARLDRIPEVKEVAQTAAVIGREFSHPLLAAVANRDEADLRAALDQLVAAELVLRRGTPPAVTYSFKHALVQDAAYQSLLKSRRQELHVRIADMIKERFPETAGNEPEVLAHHYTAAGRLQDAIVSWHEAGRKASERSAFKEAVGHLSKGLELIARLPHEPCHLEQELALQTSLGPALIATRGFAAPEVGRTYARAQELCREVGPHPGQFPAMWGSWVFHTVRADLSKANEFGDDILNLARRVDDEGLVLQAHHALETSLFWSGRFAEALEHTHSGLAIYDPEQHRPHAAIYGGHDPGVCCLGFQSLAMWICGDFDQAERSAEQAILLARELEQLGSLMHAQQLNCRLEMLKRDASALASKAELLAEIATKHGFPYPLSVARIGQGWAMAREDEVEAGIKCVRDGIDIRDRTGARLCRSLDYAMLAELLNLSGQVRSANHLVEAAFAHASDSGERFFEAELWRLRGQLLLVQEGSEAGEAELCFRKALAIAQEQGARAWELRAATSLARLWAEQGERSKAHDLLAPVYGWFTEGFETADLKEAKALLAELS